jgi:hypothetical protein
MSAAKLLVDSTSRRKAEHALIKWIVLEKVDSGRSIGIIFISLSVTTVLLILNTENPNGHSYFTFKSKAGNKVVSGFDAVREDVG